MTPFEYSILIFCILLVGSIVLLYKNRPKKLPPKTYQIYATKIHDTCTLDAEHAVIESHKLFVLALKKLSGKKENAAKIIARHQKRFPNIKKVWAAHRLRNQLAHEIGIKITEKEAEHIRQTYINALKTLL